LGNGPGLRYREQEREVQMSAMLSPTQSKFFADSLLVKPSVEAPAVRPADLKNDQLPTRRPSLGKLDPLSRLDPLAFARYLIMFFIGVTATLAWQSYGDAARETTAPAASSPDQQQLISFNLDAVRQSLDQIATSIATNQDRMTRSVDRLTAGQEQMTREITKLQAVEQYVRYKNSEPPPRPAPAAAPKPVLWPPMMR
jgi:hypothetical protein